MQNKKQAFTLVELIVVITILAILSTIWFVSYSSYLAWTRDTNRISQIKAISEGLDLYSTTRFLPLPDDKVEVLSDTTLIAYQWYAWDKILETITYSTEWVDPKDKTYFSYYLAKNKKFFQLLAFLEEEDNLQTKVSAISYTKRYPAVSWKKLWILTDANNTPIQEIEDIKTNWLDIDDVSNIEYKSFFNDNEILSWTWITFSILWKIGKTWWKWYGVEDNILIYNDYDDENSHTIYYVYNQYGELVESWFSLSNGFDITGTQNTTLLNLIGMTVPNGSLCLSGTYEEAVDWANSFNGRLPTKIELENGSTQGTGCWWDSTEVWTQTRWTIDWTRIVARGAWTTSLTKDKDEFLVANFRLVYDE